MLPQKQNITVDPQKRAFCLAVPDRAERAGELLQTAPQHGACPSMNRCCAYRAS